MKVNVIRIRATVLNICVFALRTTSIRRFLEPKIVVKNNAYDSSLCYLARRTNSSAMAQRWNRVNGS